MKKIIALSIAFLVLLSLASVSLAKMQHGNIVLDRIVIIEEDQYASSRITVKNEGMINQGIVSDFTGGKVVLLLPELQIRTSRKISVDANNREGASFLIDLENAPLGEYWVRIMVTNEDEKRVKHRIITIE